MSKGKLIFGGVIVLLIVVSLLSSGGQRTRPKTATSPSATTPTAPNSNTPSTPTTSTTPNSNTPSTPTFNNPSSTSSSSPSSTSSSSPPPPLSNSTQGVDAQENNPAIVKSQKQALASHLVFQKLPITEGGVTLGVGAFGTSQQPGIDVTYSTSSQQAHNVVASVFAQYHDSETDYEIRYSGG